jgi:hypothetical protein
LLSGVNKLGKKKEEEERNELVGKSIYIYRHDWSLERGLEGTLKAGKEGFPKIKVSRSKVITKTSKAVLIT